ncbi:MAG: AAA family ATPase [Leptotrichia hongkongensis]|nr:AAA family ATPase [Leptotrichia hongkongensis]
MLFGENGMGKTRTLCAINSIIELSKKRTESIKKLLIDLNIEHFTLNGVKYEKLIETEKVKRRGREDKFINYFSKYKNIFETYADLKLDFLSTGLVMDNFSNSQIRMCRTALKYMKRSQFPYHFSPHLIRKWSSDISLVSLNFLKNGEGNRNFSRIDYELLEIENAIHTIINNYDIDHITKINKEQDSKEVFQLRNELASTSSIIISTGDKSFEDFFEEIRKRVIGFKEKLYDIEWTKTKKFSEESETKKLSEEIELLKNKEEKFNNIIRRYFDLEVSLSSNGEFKFVKTGSELDISKFSSGEKNIIFLFLNLIFIDADIYLIDEPEVSLSLSFQKRIVGDIFEVIKGKSVIIATHAPYIYSDFKNYSKNNMAVKV